MQDKGWNIKKKKLENQFLEVQSCSHVLNMQRKAWTASLTCIRCLVPGVTYIYKSPFTLFGSVMN